MRARIFISRLLYFPRPTYVFTIKHETCCGLYCCFKHHGKNYPWVYGPWLVRGSPPMKQFPAGVGVGPASKLTLPTERLGAPFLGDAACPQGFPRVSQAAWQCHHSYSKYTYRGTRVFEGGWKALGSMFLLFFPGFHVCQPNLFLTQCEGLNWSPWSDTQQPAEWWSECHSLQIHSQLIVNECLILLNGFLPLWRCSWDFSAVIW